MMATGRKQPSGFKDIRYNVKTVIHMIEDDDGLIKGIIERKDRTKVHGQGDILVEPTMVDWQVAIDKNKNKKSFIIENNLNEAVTKERKAIEKQNEKFDNAFEEDTEKENSFNTPEEYHAAIQKAIQKLNQIEKAKVQKEISENGLNKNYTKERNIDNLKKYLEITSK